MGTERTPPERLTAHVGETQSMSGNGHHNQQSAAQAGGANDWPPPTWPPEHSPTATAERPAQRAPKAEPGAGQDTGPRLVGPLEAILRHPVIAILPVLVLIAAALVIGLARQPEYKAEARLNVGRVNVPAYNLQNVILGNATLAESYSRGIAAPEVLNPAARRVGIKPTTALDRLTATPVPGSTVIRIDSTGPSRASAIALANAASSGLKNYVVRLNQSRQSTIILRQFQQSLRDVDLAKLRVARAGNPVGASAQRAQIALQTAQLRADTLGQQYRFNLADTPAPNLVQTLAPAVQATSDFGDRLQELLLIAAVAGVVVGIALALIRANRQLLRRSRG